MTSTQIFSSNPLVITGKTPDASLNVQLHPLVLLTISDYITRHTIRNLSGPVVGSIIGQQNGRDITLEHAYECHLGKDGVSLDGDWFRERLTLFKEVHKVPPLDLTAIFLVGPIDGPQEEHLDMMRQAQVITGTDSILLLLFHPDMAENLSGGKLPLTLYEMTEELVQGSMQARFRELAYEVETGEAEMISVDFVAKGAANATAVPKVTSSASTEISPVGGSKEKKGKGKAKAKEQRDSEETDAQTTTLTTVLSAEDEELISSLNAKVNAIKMLDERLNLLRSYLEDLPKSYLNSPEDADATTNPLPHGADDEASQQKLQINHPLLRSMNALLSRLPLLAPPPPSSQTATTSSSSSSDLTQQSQQHASSAHHPAGIIAATTTQQRDLAADTQKSDVHLTTLLAQLTRSVAEAQALSSKVSVVQRERQSRDRTAHRGGGGSGGGRMAGVVGGDGGGGAYFDGGNGGF